MYLLTCFFRKRHLQTSSHRYSRSWNIVCCSTWTVSSSPWHIKWTGEEHRGCNKWWAQNLMNYFIERDSLHYCGALKASKMLYVFLQWITDLWSCLKEKIAHAENRTWAVSPNWCQSRWICGLSWWEVVWRTPIENKLIAGHYYVEHIVMLYEVAAMSSSLLPPGTQLSPGNLDISAHTHTQLTLFCFYNSPPVRTSVNLQSKIENSPLRGTCPAHFYLSVLS